MTDKKKAKDFELVLMTEYDVVYYETGGPRVNMPQQKRILVRNKNAATEFAEFFCEDRGVKFIEVIAVEGKPPTLHLHVRRKQKHIDRGVYALGKPKDMEVVIPS